MNSFFTPPDASTCSLLSIAGFVLAWSPPHHSEILMSPAGSLEKRAWIFDTASGILEDSFLSGYREFECTYANENTSAISALLKLEMDAPHKMDEKSEETLPPARS